MIELEKTGRRTVMHYAKIIIKPACTSQQYS
jgi:hypothetical protein